MRRRLLLMLIVGVAVAVVAPGSASANHRPFTDLTLYIALEPNMTTRAAIEAGEFGGISIEGPGVRKLVKKAKPKAKPAKKPVVAAEAALGRKKGGTNPKLRAAAQRAATAKSSYIAAVRALPQPSGDATWGIDSMFSLWFEEQERARKALTAVARKGGRAQYGNPDHVITAATRWDTTSYGILESIRTWDFDLTPDGNAQALKRNDWIYGQRAAEARIGPIYNAALKDALRLARQPVAKRKPYDERKHKRDGGKFSATARAGIGPDKPDEEASHR